MVNFPSFDKEAMDPRSKALRRTIVETMGAAGRGHLGPAFSLVEIMRVLYDDVLSHDPSDPGWALRDRCVLSKGHGCLALYALLADKGYFPRSELSRFCRHDGLLGGHPEHKVPGVEASTGSLGHGLSIGLGFALNARYEKRENRTFVILGDGECNEGSVWEAAMCAGKHRLSALTVLVDYNKMQSYGPTSEVQELEPLADKWRCFGFAVKEVNGHGVAELKAALTALPLDSGKPSAVICHTVKGKGIPSVENNPAWHHKSGLTDGAIRALLDELEGN